MCLEEKERADRGVKSKPEASLILLRPPSTTAACCHVQHLSMGKHGEIQETVSPQKVGSNEGIAQCSTLVHMHHSTTYVCMYTVALVVT